MSAINGTTIIPHDRVPLSRNPDDPRQPTDFTLRQPKVSPFKHNFLADRVVPRSMIDSIGMYMGTGYMSVACDNVNRNRIVKGGQLQPLGFNQSFNALPVSWKQRGIFQAEDRIGNLGAQLDQRVPFIISQKTY